MRNLIIVMFVLLVGVTCCGTPNTLQDMLANEELTDRELYSWLYKEGMGDETVPTGMIHNLILAGLKHEDPEIQHCVLSAIKIHVGINLHLIMSKGAVRNDRRLQDIPQLSDVLLNMWDEELSKVDGVLPETDYQFTLEQMKTGFPCEGARPGWVGLPWTLAYLNPRNAKVYDLIWSTLADKKTLPDKEEDNPVPLLTALYAGEFNNPKDQEFRIQALKDSTSSVFRRYAANSLAKFQSEEGLAALVEVLESQQSRFGFAQIEVIEAIIAHGDEATTKHRNLLADSLPKHVMQRRQSTNVLWIKRTLSQLPEKVYEVE